jgi:hypothetical protein
MEFRNLKRKIEFPSLDWSTVLTMGSAEQGVKGEETPECVMPVCMSASMVGITSIPIDQVWEEKFVESSQPRWFYCYLW